MFGPLEGPYLNLFAMCMHVVDESPRAEETMYIERRNIVVLIPREPTKAVVNDQVADLGDQQFLEPEGGVDVV